jgi:hypothetical protein
MNMTLKKTTFATIIALTLATVVQANSTAPIVALPENLQWHEVTNMPPGAKVAVLSGNPNKKETYVARIMLPANYSVPAHSHPVNEYDTVLSGTLFLGLGSKQDLEKGTPLPVGSFVMIPAKLKHYTWTKEQTILQITGAGPWGMIYK